MPMRWRRFGEWKGLAGFVEMPCSYPRSDQHLARARLPLDHSVNIAKMHYAPQKSSHFDILNDSIESIAKLSFLVSWESKYGANIAR